MKLPSVPGAISGVRDRFTTRASAARAPGARGSTAAGAPSSGAAASGTADRGRPPRDENPGMPMPLALQGVIELLVVAVVGLLLSAVLLGAVWAAGGFATLGAAGSFRLAGQVWLLAHWTPLTIESVQGLSLDGGGTLTLVPLGLTLIPFGLAMVAGRRIARACWRGQFLVPFLSGMLAYGLFAGLVALLSRTDQVRVELLPAALLPLIPAGLGTLVGGWSVSRSLAAVLGADAASWLERTSQYSRWAGSYVWAVIRAGFLAAVAAVGAGALLFTVTLLWHWDRVVAVYQDLGTDAAGDTALTALQFGYLPNLVLWALAWATGAGFSLGTGTISSPFESVLGPLPQVPALAALPIGDPWGLAPAVLVLPVLAGLLAGWWFCREGENHLDDWMAIRLPLRWFTFLLSTLLTVVFIAAVGAGLVSLLAWLSNGSLGIGRLTSMGPQAWQVFLWLGAELAVGAALGYLLGPWLEREGYRSRARQAEDEVDEPDDVAPHHDVAPHRGSGHGLRDGTAHGTRADVDGARHDVGPYTEVADTQEPGAEDPDVEESGGTGRRWGSRREADVDDAAGVRQGRHPFRTRSPRGVTASDTDRADTGSADTEPGDGAARADRVSSAHTTDSVPRGGGSSAVRATRSAEKTERPAAASPARPGSRSSTRATGSGPGTRETNTEEASDRASRRAEAKQRRAAKKSAKRKAARIAALDEDDRG